MKDTAPSSPQTTVIRFVVPGVLRPLERNRHRIVTKRDGGQFVSNYLPSQSRAEQAGIKIIASAAMQGAPPLEGALEMRMAVYLPVPASWSNRKRAMALSGELRPTSRPDLSNYTKQVEDGMKEIVMRDDAQITDCLIQKRYAEVPRVVVEIRREVAR